MKKEILFVIGLITSTVVYCQSTEVNTPQLQIAGVTENHKSDSVSVHEMKPAAANGASNSSNKPKSESQAPVLSAAEPKKEF